MTEKISLKQLRVLAENLFNSRDIREETRKDYIRRVRKFISFLSHHRLNTDTFLEYKRYHSKQPTAASTKNKCLVPARLLLKELNRQGVISFDPTQNIKSFHRGKKHKKEGLTLDEVRKYAEYIRQQPQDDKNRRLKALFCLFAFQGLRTIEVHRLNFNEVYLDSKRIFVQGKGRDDTEPVPMHPETAEALEKYVSGNHVFEGPLFPSSGSGPAPLTTRNIRRIMTDVMKKLGIRKTTHGFRHFFATYIIALYKGDLLKAMRRTRHYDIAMMEVYNDERQSMEEIEEFRNSFSQISLRYNKEEWQK